MRKKLTQAQVKARMTAYENAQDLLEAAIPSLSGSTDKEQTRAVIREIKAAARRFLSAMEATAVGRNRT